jgi:hypothetical protein
MKKKFTLGKDVIAIIAVSLYLLLYAVLLAFEPTSGIAVLMFLFSPLLVILMVYVVLRFGKYQGPGLNGKEFGYQDRPLDE